MGLATATCAHCGKQFTAPMHSNHHRTSRRDIARAQARAILDTVARMPARQR